MSTKTSSTAQPPGRRTPLSLNTSTKQIDKNDTKKKETTNNQKTEIAKKDSQTERTEKKTSDTRRQSSSSSSSVDTKIIKNEEMKKNQNGVNTTNGVKDKEKQNTNGKPETSAGVSTTPKKDSHSHKANEKKKEAVAPEVVAKETKNEDNKIKVDEKKKEREKTNDDKKLDEKKKEVVVEKKKVDEKPSEEKTTVVKISEKSKVGEAAAKSEVIDLDSSGEKPIKESPIKEKKKAEVTTSRIPIKEKKIVETPKPEEKPVQSPAESLQDVEMMEHIVFAQEPSTHIIAASTPAKTYNRREVYTTRFEEPPKTSPKSDVKLPRSPVQQQHTPDRKSCPRTFSSISGRRTIRPIGDYTFSGNLHIRESYRKINTELDFTTSSLNVTVGSEVPNNDSFSFFSKSRKRDRSSPSHQSAMEVQSDLSPKSPKRARIDFGMTGFFNAMASPITMLRARLSRATVQSTPKKREGLDAPIEEDIVENVSGISVEEEITTTEDLIVNPDSTVDNAAIDADEDLKFGEPAAIQKPGVEDYDDEIKIKETITATDSQAKKKCIIM